MNIKASSVHFQEVAQSVHQLSKVRESQARVIQSKTVGIPAPRHGRRSLTAPESRRRVAARPCGRGGNKDPASPAWNPRGALASLGHGPFLLSVPENRLEHGSGSECGPRPPSPCRSRSHCTPAGQPRPGRAPDPGQCAC